MWSRKQILGVLPSLSSKVVCNSEFTVQRTSMKIIFFSGNSNEFGVLLTHHENFKFHQHHMNRDGSTSWFRCSKMKADGCQGRATVTRSLTDPDDPGSPVTFALRDVSTPEHHGQWHKPDRGGILADKLLVQMKAEVERDPTMPVGKKEYFN